MNVFDTLFPPRSRARESRPQSRRQAGRPGRNRLRDFGAAEQLEHRNLLAWAGSVTPGTPETFFIDPGNNFPGGGSVPNPMTSQYASYTIKNDELGAKDIWVRAVLTPMGPGETRRVGFGTGFNNEDGIYHVGSVAGGGGERTAFLYFTDVGPATPMDDPDPTDQPYNLEVWEGKPDPVGGTPLATASFKYDQIVVANRNSSSKINTVSFVPPIPPAGLFVGDSLTLNVSGYLGTAADQVLFTPATRTDWQPDTFELRSTKIELVGTTLLADNQIWDPGISPKVGQQDFNAAYTFLIAQPSIPGSGPTIVSPTQFINDINESGKDRWDHHDPSSETLPLIPEAKYKLDLTKTDGSPTYTPGAPVTYTMTLSNSGNIGVDGVVISDTLPGAVVNWATSSIADVQLVNATEVVAINYNPATGQLGGTVNVGAGGSVTIIFTAQTLPSATVDLVNFVYAQPPKGDKLTGKDESSPLFVAPLTIDKTAFPTSRNAGESGTFTIVVTNGGPSDAQNVVVVDTLPEGFVPTGYGPLDPGQSVSYPLPGANQITWDIGKLKQGPTQLVVYYTIGSDVPAGLKTNVATVTSDTAGPATDDAEVMVTSGVDLDITKTGDKTYKAGGPLNFTVVVTNKGPSFASGVRFLDLPPAGTLPLGVVNWSWTVTYTGGGSGTADGSPDSVTNSTAGIDKLMNLAVLGTATFKITALTQTGFTSDISNTARATIGQEVAEATFSSAYNGPINPTSDVAALVIGTDDGCGVAPWVRVLDPITGTILSQFLAYEPGFRGGVRVTSGDMDGDGIAEIIVAPGRNRIGQIRVFTPQGVELTQYRTWPFGTAFRGGVEVAVGDVDGDGDNDIVAGMSTGMPMVSVFAVTPGAGDPVANVPFRSFRAFPAPYANGTMVATGDFGTYFNGVKVSPVPDGVAEIVTGTNAGIRAWTRIFDVSVTPKVVRGAFVISPAFRGGVTLSTARWDGDAIDDVIVGAGVGGNSIVEVYSGASGAQLARLTAFSSFLKTNARAFAAALDLTGDGIVDNLYGVKGLNGGGGARGVRQYARGTGIVSQLSSSPLLTPPLRIAPITLRVLTGG